MKKEKPEEVVSAEKEKVIATAKKTDKKIPETVVYCGPTIKGVAQQFTAYNNGIPKKLKEYAKSNLSARRLIVPLDKLVQTKKNIMIQGTIENISFNNIKGGE